MPWLKVYEWERETWPEFHEAGFEVYEAKCLLVALAEQFEVPVPKLSAWKRHGAGAYCDATQTIFVCTPLFPVCVIVHEFTHHLLWLRHRDVSHRKRFRNTLQEVYEQSKRFLDTHGSWEPVNRKQDVLVKK